jgi:hypothetical protein
MAFDKDAFLSAMDSMTVMELNDLVKAIEEKFGVSAAAMAAPAAGGGSGHRSGGHAELLFDCLDQVVQFHDGHAVQGGQEGVFVECHLSYLYRFQ